MARRQALFLDTTSSTQPRNYPSRKANSRGLFTPRFSQIFRFSIFCAEATFGVSEIVSAYYGQLSGKCLDIKSVVFARAPGAGSLLGCYSFAIPCELAANWSEIC